MSFPKHVKKNEPMKVSWANAVVDNLKHKPRNAVFPPIGGKKKKNFKPFDPLFVEWQGASRTIKIEPGFLIDYNSNELSEIQYEETNLSEYPEITIPNGKDLFYNYKDKKLVWEDPDSKGNLKILEFTYTGGGTVEIRNTHPSFIDLRKLPPFTPLLSQSGTSFFVALIPGYVNERIPSPTGGALAKHLPIDLLDGALLKHHAIANDQQVTIKVSVNVAGQIQAAEGENSVELVIEAKDEDSTHFYPPCGDDQEGQTGTFHYCICYLTGDSLTNVFAGSHLDHWQDIPTIDNTTTEATEGTGRVVKEYKNTEDKFLIRTIKQRDENPQIKIVEHDESIEVTGNSLSGSLLLVQGETYEGQEPEELLDWKDGLVAKSGDKTITIPQYQAGTNIEITGPVNNVYTINCTLSTNSLSSATLSGKTGTIRAYYGNDLDVVHGEFENGLYTDPGGDSIIEIPYYNAGQGISITPDGANEFTISSTLTGRNLNLEVNEVHYDNNGHVYYDSYSSTLYFRNGLFVGVEDPGSPEDLILRQVSHIVGQA